jgi:hypothetical protein
MRSIFAASTMGMMTAVVSTTIEIPSRKHPRIRNRIVSAKMRPYCDSPRVPIQLASARGIPA